MVRLLLCKETTDVLALTRIAESFTSSGYKIHWEEFK